MNTVKEFRQAGYKVRVQHVRKITAKPQAFNSTVKEIRESAFYFEIKPEISAKGGMTIIEVRSPEGQEIHEIAYCNECDNYNRRTGVTIALERIKQKLT